MMFNGMRVIANAALTEAGEPYEVRRSWKERLFSRPWTPLLSTRTVVPQVPLKGGYQIARDTLMMHPETIRQLKLALRPTRQEGST